MASDTTAADRVGERGGGGSRWHPAAAAAQGGGGVANGGGDTVRRFKGAVVMGRSRPRQHEHPGMRQCSPVKCAKHGQCENTEVASCLKRSTSNPATASHRTCSHQHSLVTAQKARTALTETAQAREVRETRPEQKHRSRVVPSKEVPAAPQPFHRACSHRHRAVAASSCSWRNRARV